MTGSARTAGNSPIIYTTMDAGFRPKEVGRAKLSWLDVENGMLRIPKEESTKNTDNWHVALSDRTASMLRKWVSERENYEKYWGTDTLWLTKYGNPLQFTLAQLPPEATLRHSGDSDRTPRPHLVLHPAQRQHPDEPRPGTGRRPTTAPTKIGRESELRGSCSVFWRFAPVILSS